MPELRDNFNSYTSGQPLPTPWSRIGDTIVIDETPTNKIVQAKASSSQGIGSSAYPSAFRNDIASTADQRSELLFKGYGRGDAAFEITLRSGPCVRGGIQPTQTGDVPKGYSAWLVLGFAAGSSTPTVSLWLVARYVSGGNFVEVILAQTTLGSVPTGKVIGVEARQNVISAYISGSLVLQATDNNITSGDMGFSSRHSWGGTTNSVDMRWDNFLGHWDPAAGLTAQTLSLIPKPLSMRVYRDPP